MRYLRFAILVLLIVAVLVPATLYAVAYFLVNSELGRTEARARVAALFPKAGLGFEDVEVGAVPVDLHVHNLQLGPDAQNPLARIEHLAVGVDPRSFLGDRTRVDLVHVDGFEVRLELDETGRLTMADLFQGPLTPQPGEPREPGKPMDLRDLVLSDGTIRVQAPGWSLRLHGASCAGRVASGTPAELALSCSWAGGEAQVTPPGAEPVTLNLGPSRIETIHVQNDGKRLRRLVIDGLRLELDGQTLQGSLIAAPPDGGGVPVFTLALNGRVPESVMRLVSQRRVEGALTVDLKAQGDAERLELAVERLAVEGRVRLPDRSLTDPTLTEVTVEAKDRNVSIMGKASVGGVSGGDVRASDVALQAALLARLPEGGVAQLLAQSAGAGDGSVPAPAVAPESVQVHVDRLNAGELTADGVRVNGLAISDVDAEWAGLKATVRLGRAQARTVAAGAQQLADLSLKGEAAVEWPKATAKVRLDLGTAGVGGGRAGALDATATVAMEREGFTVKLPLTIDLRVLDVPGAWLAALSPAESAARTELTALLPGPVNGTLRLTGDARKPGALQLAAADLRVPREKDVVLLGPAEAPLAAEAGTVAVDPASRRLRLGPATFAWQTERVKRPR